MVTASKANSTNMPILQNISENMVGWHYLNYFNCFAINHNMHQVCMFSGLFCDLQFKVTELLNFNTLLNSLHVSQHLALWRTEFFLKFFIFFSGSQSIRVFGCELECQCDLYGMNRRRRWEKGVKRQMPMSLVVY